MQDINKFNEKYKDDKSYLVSKENDNFIVINTIIDKENNYFRVRDVIIEVSKGATLIDLKFSYDLISEKRFNVIENKKFDKSNK